MMKSFENCFLKLNHAEPLGARKTWINIIDYIGNILLKTNEC